MDFKCAVTIDTGSKQHVGSTCFNTDYTKYGCYRSVGVICDDSHEITAKNVHSMMVLFFTGEVGPSQGFLLPVCV